MTLELYILKMIVYNVYPSFVLSQSPSYLLQDTHLANFYSIEFDLYKGMVADVYEQMGQTLDLVAGYEWENRRVLEAGVIENTYTNGGETHFIIINYTQNNYNYNGTQVPAQSAKFVR